MDLQRLTAHLAKRLTVLHDGQPTVFRDSAVTPTPMSQSAPDFFRHPQGVCSHGQCRADAATGRKEGGIDDIEIVQIVRPIPPIERTAAMVGSESACSTRVGEPGSILVTLMQLDRGQTGESVERELPKPVLPPEIVTARPVSYFPCRNPVVLVGVVLKNRSHNW